MPIGIPIQPPQQQTVSYSAQDIIKSSMRSLGLLSKGEAPSADEVNDALQALNIMIDAWSARKLLGQALVKEHFTLVENQQDYTIGPGGNFNTTKPFDITSAYYTDGSGVRYPLDIVNREMFDSYVDADIVSARPMALFYDPGETQQSTQMGTISLYFTPDGSSVYTLYIDSHKPFTEFSNLTDIVTFPKAYLRAIKFNLALEIAPEYGNAVSAEAFKIVRDGAIESLEDIEALNSKQLVAGLDLPGKKGKAYNWISDEAL